MAVVVNNLLFLAYAHHNAFDSMLGALGRGVMWASAFRVVRALPLPLVGVAVLLILVIAWAMSRRG